MRRPPEILHTAVLPTPFGDFLAHFSAEGLARLDFPVERPRRAAEAELPAPFRAWAQLAQAALQTALTAAPRRVPKLILPPLDLSQGTKFRLRVWPELLRIPCGETRSYGELAKMIEAPRAIRAVARSCATNPVSLAVPCHRVVGSDGDLTGYRWGVPRKREMLARERRAAGG